MIVTIRCDLTWDGMNKGFFNSSEKKLKRILKDMTGASEVDIISVDGWDEDTDDDNGEIKR